MEHLEPEPGALLQFHDGPDLPSGVEGHRWEVFETRYPDPLYVRIYRLWRIDMPAVRLQVTQATMDRCGRLLLSGESEG